MPIGAGLLCKQMLCIFTPFNPRTQASPFSIYFHFFIIIQIYKYKMVLYIIFFILVILLALLLILANDFALNRLYNGGSTKVGNPQRVKGQYARTYKIFYNNEYTRETYQYLINKLNSLGWKEITHKTNYVDFAFSLLNNNRNIEADLKYSINGFKQLVEKDLLIKNMKNLKYMPHKEDIKDYKYIDGKIIIIKEALVDKQNGIHIIVDKNEFIKLKNKFISENIRAICSTYINNPLLFRGKKFHLRILIGIFLQKNGHSKITYIKKYIPIATAKLPFVIKSKEDYLDKDMNISCGAITNEIAIWPESFQKYENTSDLFIKKCNTSIHDAIHSISLKNLSLYDEQNAGLFMYGADLILDNTGHAWILELNERPGFFNAAIKNLPKNEKNKCISDFYSELFK